MPNLQSLALFDFDHTVTTTDTYSRFLRRVATPQQLTRAKWSVGPWLAGYRLGLVSAQALRKRVTRIVFAGRAAEEIAAHAQAYAREVLPTLLRPEMMQRIAWHQAQGDSVVLVSASLDLYLQPWCEQHGLGLICNRLEARDGQLSGCYADGDCGPHKARLIRAQYDLAAYPRVYAYGDSREDRPMLALAHERWYRGRRIT
ncbi:HAD family hydrolase [Xanthomonas tesorieronis]|uniref:HAD family hydrolase n=1 Tax=Xanthomonas tesorieronis TaxID=3160839 RepID=UPI0035115C7D